MRKWFLIILMGLLLFIVNFSTSAEAHRSGCHRWHSCPSDRSTYVCGDLGYPCKYPTYSTRSHYSTPVYSTPNDNNWSDNSVLGTQTYCSDFVSTPSNITATAIGRGKVELTWSSYSSYEYVIIYYSDENNGVAKYSVPNAGNSGSFTIGALTSRKIYYFWVTAKNGCAYSLQSYVLSIRAF